ncbi:MULTISPECIES: bifunctional (p)ppGpp synthetase/guanosine-3',5'-bis(diphosphate) 3'-pyrophosphohydrolase [unclassified Aureispira]|uniref:RelA/SpoT family protein n=1 Tax=unclassified Aureispira TaxID=2649989 RepID=UPI000695BF69|nr:MULTISPECIES: RelA/SpoT family protein [unclassified Aureispira]WMX15697.1 RelA/SpoT family protein [Aureispira sp. CCB-E]
METNFNIKFPYEEDITQEEDKQIHLAYRKMCRSIRTPLNEEHKASIKKAYLLARLAHSQQRRKSGELYIFHPIEVARICAAELGLGPTSIKAALLHDVVEDTPVSLEDLASEFGENIAMIVDGLTKFSSLANVSEENIHSPQAENFKKILLTISKDVRVVLIKMADRLHNMRTLGSMPQHKQLKIASETSFIYAPLAHRLGFYNIKNEMEDLCLKIKEPEHYEFIIQKLQETANEREQYITQFLKPIKKAIKKKHNIQNFRVFGRAKSVSSISNKLKTKQVPFEEIYDLFAIRIIADVPISEEKSICWSMYSIITDSYTPVPERLKDWISTPKSNGYESLHTTVMGPQGRFVEVQIRSERMDEVAERGYAAHWRYKGIKQQENIFENWLSKAREMLENPDNDAIDFLNDFKSSLFAEEVYVFTPQGEMRFFPKGATALDFAFDIHTEVGYHCKSIKVSQRIVPLSYELKNGDQLYIITSSTQKPTEDWLKIVKTGKARSKIRQALKEEKLKWGSLGKETLDRKFKSLKLTEHVEDNIDTLVKYFGASNRLDLYFGIYSEQYNLNEIKLLKLENGKLFPEKAESDDKANSEQQTKIKTKVPLRARRNFKGTPKLLIDGQDASNFVNSLATCCNPVLGDDIFAYVTSKHGIKIHRTTCPNAEYLQATFGYRIKRAEWVDTANTSFIAELLITGMDDMGVVQSLSSIITDKHKLNMRGFSMNGKEGHFEGKVTVVVKNKDQLNELIIELKKLKQVNTVARIQ